MTIATAQAKVRGSSEANLSAARVDPGLTYATDIIQRVCGLAGSFNLIEDIRRSQEGRRLRRAVTHHDTAALYDWLATTFSYQGVSNRAAAEYMRRHGSVTWNEIDRALQGQPGCPKLGSYWAFQGCRYDKLSHTCAEPEHIHACPLPQHHLRNGHRCAPVQSDISGSLPPLRPTRDLALLRARRARHLQRQQDQ